MGTHSHSLKKRDLSGRVQGAGQIGLDKTHVIGGPKKGL